MFVPAISLYAGDPDPRVPDGWRRPWYGPPLAFLAVALPLVVLALVGYLLVRLESPAWLTGGEPPGLVMPVPDADAGPAQPAPAAGDVAGVRAPAPAQFTGVEPFEAQVSHPGGLLLVRMAHRGDGPFAVDVVGPHGSVSGDGAVIDVTGVYQGTRAFGAPAGTYRLDVSAGARWGVVVEQPRFGQETKLPRTIAGVGDTATRPFAVTTDRPLRMAWRVEADAAGDRAGGATLHVRLLDAAGAVVTEFDAADGDLVEHEVPAGTYLLDVSTTAGVWRVAVS